MTRLFFTPESIAKLTEVVCDNIEKILDHLEVKYSKYDNVLGGTCPVHRGDNPTAFNLFLTGDTMRGNWVCYTRRCQKHKDTPRNIFGLLKGILRHDRPNISFYEVLNFCCEFLKISSIKDLENIKVKPRPKYDPLQILNKKNKELAKILNRDAVRSRLIIPPRQLLDRGLSHEILNEYDIGFCANQNKFMSNRIVVPIYDDSHKFMVGCVGRSIYNQCPKCKMYHEGNCPDQFHPKYAKWVNSKGFKSTSCFFNYWAAKQEIQKKRTIILVEGKWDCLKLVQAGIRNVVSIFGDDVSDEQYILLEKCGVFNVIPLLDNDPAGTLGKEKITEECGNLYNVVNLTYPKKDIGELSDQEIQEYIAKPLLKIHENYR